MPSGPGVRDPREAQPRTLGLFEGGEGGCGMGLGE